MATRRPSVRTLLVAAAALGAVASFPAAGDERPGPAIGARNAHAMAYDARRGRVVLFGGADASAVPGDTREWDGTRWLLRETADPQPHADNGH